MPTVNYPRFLYYVTDWEGKLTPPDLSRELYEELRCSHSYEEWFLAETLKYEIEFERRAESKFEVRHVGVSSKSDEDKVRMDIESKVGFNKWIT